MIILRTTSVLHGFRPALKPGRVIRVTFSPGHPGLTRIGSREKRNCSFDDLETYKRYRVALSCATPTYRITNIREGSYFQ